MRATLWQGTGEMGMLRRAILEDVFAAADIPLAAVSTQDEVLAAAARSRRADDHDFVVIDCAAGDPSDVDRCVAVATRTTLAVHIIHPREETFRDIERVVGRPLVWLPANFTVASLLDKLHTLKAQVVATDQDAARERPALTPREREVLDLLAQGRDNREIATLLRVSMHTVKSHVRGITSKLRLTRAQVIATYRDGDEGMELVGTSGAWALQAPYAYNEWERNYNWQYQTVDGSPGTGLNANSAPISSYWQPSPSQDSSHSGGSWQTSCGC